jgi:hypothetical protein
MRFLRWLFDSTGRHTISSRPMPVDSRKPLPDRRDARRVTVVFEFSNRTVRHFEIGFGLEDSGIVREVFCCGAHTQSDLQLLVEDACVATSIALQYGARIGKFVKSFGELREEGATSGPPASIMGAIARAGVALERDIMEGRA